MTHGGVGALLHVAAAATLILYAAAVVFLLRAVQGRSPRAAAAGARLSALGAAGLTLCLLLTYSGVRVFSTAGDYLVVVAWAVEVSARAIAARQPAARLYASGAVLAVLTTSSYLSHDRLEPRPPAGFAVLLLHVGPAVAAEAALLLIFVLAGAFLVQERRLKNKTPDVLSPGAPSLSSLSGTSLKVARLGCLLMGVSVVTGALLRVAPAAAVGAGDVTVWSALSSWALLGILGHLLPYAGWSARRSALTAVVGVPLVLGASFLASAVTGQSFHSGVVD